MRILVVEDEEKIANMIKRGLEEHRFVVDVVHDGLEAMFAAEVNPYDAIILDVLLPNKNGLSVCRDLRKNNVNSPILMLTARNSLQERVLGLDAGADDYLGKPFSFTELVARVRALLRRDRNQKLDRIQVADLEMNLLTHGVKRGGKDIPLTTKEYMLLEYLMTHSNEVVTRTMISEHVWHESFNSLSNVIDVHIKYLRNKVDTGFKTKLIQTIRGTGYILKDDNKKPVKAKR